MHNYHSAHDEFPAGWEQTKLPSNRHYRIAGTAMLLPYIEQNQLYSLIMEHPERHPWDHTNDPANNDVSPYITPIPAFRCPSDGTSYPNNQHQPTNYRMNRGDTPTERSWDESRHNHRGLFGSGRLGPFTMASMSDGTSNTMAFAEGVIVSDSNSEQVVGGIALGQETALDQANGMINRPINWLSVRGSGKSFRVGVITPSATGYASDHTPYSRGLGRRWGDGNNTFASVWTILPPNSPAVCRLTDPGDNIEVWTIVPPSSYHPGGVGTVAGDGSYRYVSDSVDTSSSPPPRKSGITATGLSLAYGEIQGVDNDDDVRGYTGPSPWGVWGAYGSKAGGESTSL